MSSNENNSNHVSSLFNKQVEKGKYLETVPQIEIPDVVKTACLIGLTAGLSYLAKELATQIDNK
jgi:hypothetical protein